MRLLRAGLAIGFVAALGAAFYRTFFVPPVSWPEWALLTVGVSTLGGVAIGRRWAIGTAFAVNVFLALLVITVGEATNGHIELGTAFLVVQVLVATGATAAAIRVRGGLASRFARH